MPRTFLRAPRPAGIAVPVACFARGAGKEHPAGCGKSRILSIWFQNHSSEDNRHVTIGNQDCLSQIAPPCARRLRRHGRPGLGACPQMRKRRPGGGFSSSGCHALQPQSALAGIGPAATDFYYRRLISAFARRGIARSLSPEIGLASPKMPPRSLASLDFFPTAGERQEQA
jgi:hypothetical protein